MKRIVFLVFVLGFNFVLSGQNVGISSTPFTPDVSAGLDIQFSDKGLLIPRVALASSSDASTISLPAISLLVYCDGTAGLAPAGYYYNTGTPAMPNWTLLMNDMNINGRAWLINGNSGVSSATHFIGTTDNQPLNFRVNNVRAGHVGVLGDNSVFLGYEAGLSDNGSDNRNVFVGSGSGRNNTTGDENTACGYLSLQNNTDGFINTAFGSGALRLNTTGTGNCASGSYSVYSNISGSWNTACGYAALYSNTTGSQNTAMGYYALFSNISGYQNTAIGFGTMKSNRAGSFGTAIGYYSMHYTNDLSATFINYNTAVGAFSLQGSTIAANNTGNFNTAIGYESGLNNSIGSHNTVIGYQSLRNNCSGSYNTSSGSLSLLYNDSGSYNVAAGYGSMFSNSSGSYNTAIGFYANFFGNYSNTVALGYNVNNNANNQVRIGNSSISSIGGQVSWTALSDARIKSNVQEDVVGLDFIMKLRPVTYYFDKDKQDELMGVVDSSDCAEKYAIEKTKFSGFLAQDVEKAAIEVGYDFSGIDKNNVVNGGLYGLRYAEFVVPLVKATQEQQAIMKNNSK
ncbi:MAG: tail fiber domain-containing protein [Bacteroidales bacterium]|nr:tail fiber domain-containing protein [Bacteroidales bacterium]